MQLCLEAQMAKWLPDTMLKVITTNSHLWEFNSSDPLSV